MKSLPKTTSIRSLPLLAALISLAGSAGLQAAAISCNINSEALAFRIYDDSDPAPTDSIGSVDVQCTNMDVNTNTANVALGLSAGANGTISDRKMAGNGHLLRYGVFSDAARSSSWGQGMDAVQQSSGPLGPNQSKLLHYTLFGRIPAQQNQPPGTYFDQLVLTVTP